MRAYYLAILIELGILRNCILIRVFFLKMRYYLFKLLEKLDVSNEELLSLEVNSELVVGLA